MKFEGSNEMRGLHLSILSHCPHLASKGVGTDMADLSEFLVVLLGSVLILNLHLCCLKDPMRQEACAHLFSHTVNTLLQSGVRRGMADLGELLVILHGPVLVMNILPCCLKDPMR
jgi:hypothetical protein